MYYKVISNDKVVDAVKYLKYARQHKEGHIILCDENAAQLIVSSDENSFYHLDSLKPIDNYPTVSIIDIDEFEYKELKKYGGETREEIIDSVISALIEDGVI